MTNNAIIALFTFSQVFIFLLRSKLLMFMIISKPVFTIVIHFYCVSHSQAIIQMLKVLLHNGYIHSNKCEERVSERDGGESLLRVLITRLKHKR